MMPGGTTLDEEAIEPIFYAGIKVLLVLIYRYQRIDYLYRH